MANSIIETPNSFSSKVLILNQNFEPLSICGLHKAIILLWLNKATLIEVRPNRFIHSTYNTYPFPSVIKLDRYVRLPYKKVELSRKNIFRRDNFKCVYCGKTTQPLTLDHVIPKSRNGGTTWENLVCACIKCNNKKGDRTLEEFGLKLNIKPSKPNYITFLRNVVGRVEDEWELYLTV